MDELNSGLEFGFGDGFSSRHRLASEKKQCQHGQAGKEYEGR